MEEEGLLSSFVLRVPGEHRMPQPENCLLQRPTCLGRSSSISSGVSLSILRYRGRFLAFSSTVRTSGEGCAFTSHQLVPRKGLCTGQMGARPRGDPDLGGRRQKVWVATKRPTKKVYQMLFLDFPRPVGTVEFKRVWKLKLWGRDYNIWEIQGSHILGNFTSKSRHQMRRGFSGSVQKR